MTAASTATQGSAHRRRSARFALVAVLAFASFLFPGAAVAADAPNSCAAATSARPQNTWLSESISSPTDVDWYRFDKASSGYALITLGRLATDFDLYLYRPCSTLVASSHRSNTQFDQIYRNLGAGTYYVKVVGFAGRYSATAYALRFRPLSESVQVLSLRAPWTDSAGYLHLQGEVLNNTAYRRRWIQLNATIFNSSNGAVGSGVGYTDVALMLPRTRSPFEIVVRKPATYHHASVLVARSTPTTTSPVANLALSGGGLSLVGGLPHFRGEVTNRNSGGVRLTQVLTTMYDTYGNVAGLGWAYASPASIGAGASAAFDVAGSGTAAPNRYVSQAQARGTGCYAAPRYAPAAMENFTPTTSAPATINRTSASQRVALTFDMGGRMDPAVAILNRLVQYKVCATIFPTGAISDTPDGRAALAIVRAHPELFELANHTMDHCDLVRGGGGAPGSAEAAICASMPLSGAAYEAFVKKQLTDGESSIVAATGRGTRSFWRAPYGSLNSTVLRWAAEAGWRTHFKWDVDTIDWKPVSQGGPTATSMALKVVNNARSGTVVLLHLGGFETLDALPAMIDGLRSRGFTLTTLSDMAQ
jgi:peptidoglycan/xylan/chitin deacetylase (PgdA/CDA1 family)